MDIYTYIIYIYINYTYLRSSNLLSASGRVLIVFPYKFLHIYIYLLKF